MHYLSLGSCHCWTKLRAPEAMYLKADTNWFLKARHRLTVEDVIDVNSWQETQHCVLTKSVHVLFKQTMFGLPSTVPAGNSTVC